MWLRTHLVPPANHLSLCRCFRVTENGTNLTAQRASKDGWADYFFKKKRGGKRIPPKGSKFSTTIQQGSRRFCLICSNCANGTSYMLAVFTEMVESIVSEKSQPTCSGAAAVGGCSNSSSTARQMKISILVLSFPCSQCAGQAGNSDQEDLG